MKEMDKAEIVFEKIGVTQGKVFKSILGRLKTTPDQVHDTFALGAKVLRLTRMKSIMKRKALSDDAHFVKYIQKTFPKK